MGRVNIEIKKAIDMRRELIMKSKAANEPDILVYDGIVDEKSYAKQGKRVLFLLRDGNDPNRYEDGNGYIHCDLYQTAVSNTKNETPRTRLNNMWRYMCMWMRIIKEPTFTLDQCWTEENGFDVDGMRGYLLDMAVINIKKSAGKGINDETYGPALRRAVNSYYELIKEQISLIKPQLVICGGTFDYIKDEYDVLIKKLPNGKRFFIYNECVYLEYWHPSARFGYEKHFEYFKEIYKELCAIINNV